MRSSSSNCSSTPRSAVRVSGTQVMHRLIDEATRASSATTLGVVKTNPALRLYQRLGFAVTHEDERKLYIRRERDAAPPTRR